MTTFRSESREDPMESLAFDPVRHHYFLGGVWLPNVTAVLAHAGLLDYGFLSPEHREACLARGAAVHRLTQLNDQQRLTESSVPLDLRGYLEAWQAFKQDFGFTPQWIERRVANAQYRFAGTIDRAGTVRHRTHLLVDIKTGEAPAATRLQTAAYISCLPHPRLWLRRAVELGQDGTYRVIPYETSAYQRDFNVFLTALERFKNKEAK
jgi:hypothetical protein